MRNVAESKNTPAGPRSAPRVHGGNAHRPEVNWRGQTTDRLMAFAMQAFEAGRPCGAFEGLEPLAKATEELASRGWGLEEVVRWLPESKPGSPSLGEALWSASPQAFERLLAKGWFPWKHSGLKERFKRELAGAPQSFSLLPGVGALAGAALFEAGRPDGSSASREPCRLAGILCSARPGEQERAIEGALAALEALGQAWARRGVAVVRRRQDSARAALDELFGGAWPESIQAGWTAMIARAQAAGEAALAARPIVEQFALALRTGEPWRDAIDRLAELGPQALGTTLACPEESSWRVDALSPLGMAAKASAWDAALEIARAGAPWGKRIEDGSVHPFGMLSEALARREEPPAWFWGGLGPALGGSVEMGEQGERDAEVARLAQEGLRQAAGMASSKAAAAAALTALEIGLSAAPARTKSGPRL